jgi:hypothetical protein
MANDGKCRVRTLSAIFPVYTAIHEFVILKLGGFCCRLEVLRNAELHRAEGNYTKGSDPNMTFRLKTSGGYKRDKAGQSSVISYSPLCLALLHVPRQNTNVPQLQLPT